MQLRQYMPVSPSRQTKLALTPPWQPEVLLLQLLWPLQFAEASGQRRTSYCLAERLK
jgi:hypothetical protein